MEHFNGKVMMEFDNNAILDICKVIAASLIDKRDNGDVYVEKVMEEEVVKRNK
jgi:hypothetical protein